MRLPDKSNRVYSEPIVLDYFIFYYTEVGIFYLLMSQSFEFKREIIEMQSQQ